MGVNTMSFNQLATVLNSIVSQATGQAQITPTDTSSFVSLAKIGLETGYDPLMNAINQVLTKTIFSMRPYSAKFKGLMADAEKYGNHVRKLQMIDSTFVEDDRIKLTDGYSMDQQVVKKPKVLQTNFYGENVYEDYITIFKDQLDTAFSGPEEFGRFIAMVMQNLSDRFEQARENMARMTVANLIGAKYAADSSNVIYLLDVYEDKTGVTLDADEVRDPDNFVPFMRWLMGYLKTISDRMGERSLQYHKTYTVDGTALPVMRHTPIANQKAYFFTEDLNNLDSTVLSSTFHDKYLSIMDHEGVNFWQSIDTPMGISIKPGYNDTDGSVVSNPEAVVLSNVFGVIFDEEAAGFTQINEWSQPAPFNARGGYTNYWYHFTLRYWNDLSENAVVLILDHSDRQLGSLTVESEAGSTSGKTAITVDDEPDTDKGEFFCYKVGDAAQTVVYGTPVLDWTAWDGDDEITAATGKVITVVIANAQNKAIVSGYATVVAKA